MPTDILVPSRLNSILRYTRRPGVRLAILAVVAVASVLVFLTVGIVGSWDFAVPVRARKV